MKNSSQYKLTPTKDFYLDIWTQISVAESNDDNEFQITSKYSERPDLLSYDLYGTPKFWWVFALRNKDILIDPIFDFKEGTKIMVPSNLTVENL